MSREMETEYSSPLAEQVIKDNFRTLGQRLGKVLERSQTVCKCPRLTVRLMGVTLTSTSFVRKYKFPSEVFNIGNKGRVFM